jgi:DNA-binding beta-propeller fold protein YncE
MCRKFFAGGLPFVLLLVFFSRASASILQNPQFGSSVDSIIRPTDVAAGADGSLYVADRANQIVQVFDAEGRFRFSFSAPDSPKEELGSFPHQLAVDAEGTVYATQLGSGIIRAFSSDGTFLFRTDGGGRIRDARQIAVGPNHELFVVDHAAPVVHVLDAQGAWLRSFDQGWGATATDSDGRLYIARSRSVAVFDPSGNRLADFSLRDVGFERRQESALAISGDHLYVGDSYAGIIDRYTLDGTFVDTAYGFPQVDGMGVGPGGEVYLAHEWARSVDRVTPEDFASRHVGVTRFFDRPNYSWMLEILDRTGIGRNNRNAETAAETFIVPGEPGEIVELTFSYFHKGGALEPRFGVFDRGLVTAHPIEQPVEFAIQALEARLLEFTRPGSSLPDGTQFGTISVAADTELGFYMFANPLFLASTDRAIAELRSMVTQWGSSDAYERLQRIDAWGRRDRTIFPYFSIAGANHGRVDQFVTFLGDEFTVIAIEDTLLRSIGDVDLTDMVIKINARLIPVPEPAAGALAIVAGALCALFFTYPRRCMLAYRAATEVAAPKN